jgi:hypothetical protein
VSNTNSTCAPSRHHLMDSSKMSKSSISVIGRMTWEKVTAAESKMVVYMSDQT